MRGGEGGAGREAGWVGGQTGERESGRGREGRQRGRGKSRDWVK